MLVLSDALQLFQAAGDQIALIVRVETAADDLLGDACREHGGLVVNFLHRLFARGFDVPERLFLDLFRFLLGAGTDGGADALTLCGRGVGKQFAELFRLPWRAACCSLSSVASAFRREASASAMSLRMRSSRAFSPASTFFQAVCFRSTTRITKMMMIQIASVACTSDQASVFPHRPDSVSAAVAVERQREKPTQKSPDFRRAISAAAGDPGNPNAPRRASVRAEDCRIRRMGFSTSVARPIARRNGKFVEPLKSLSATAAGKVGERASIHPITGVSSMLPESSGELQGHQQADNQREEGEPFDQRGCDDHVRADTAARFRLAGDAFQR